MGKCSCGGNLEAFSGDSYGCDECEKVYYEEGDDFIEDEDFDYKGFADGAVGEYWDADDPY